jgi:hypothetical protein
LQVRNKLVYLYQQNSPNMETITLKRTQAGTWMKRYDDYETKFARITKAEALQSIQTARETGRMFADDNENDSSGTPLVFGYQN